MKSWCSRKNWNNSWKFWCKCNEYILSEPYKDESPISIIKVDNKLNQNV